MQFLLLLTVILAVAIAEHVPPQPVSDGTLRLLLAALTMAIAPLFAVATSVGIAGSLQKDFDRHKELLRRFGRLRQVHLLVWLLATTGVLYLLGWAQMVRFNWNLDGLFLLDDLLIFMPVVVPLVLSWGAFYEVERSLHRTVANHASDGASTSRLATRRQYVQLHVRHYLGVLLLPAFSVLAVQDLLRYLGPALPEHWALGLLLLPVVGMLLFFSVALRHLWQTQPLPEGALRERLLHLCRRAGFSPGDLILWQTDRLVVNAAVAGFVPRWRYVFFTDLLLARFDDDEVEQILAHEIGHVCHHHLRDRLMILALPVALWLVLAGQFPDGIAWASGWLAAAGLNATLQPMLLAPLALAGFSATVFAACSRRLEHDADLFAARACHPQGRHSAEGCQRMIDVLEKLAFVSGMDRHARSWLHPSIARRVALLEQVAADAAYGNRYEERIRWQRRAVALAVLAAVGWLLVVSV